MRFHIEERDDLAACEEAVALQVEVWGEAVTVPSNMLLATLRAGGFLAIARVGSEPVGFVYSFYGIRDGRPLHHSHMLAVRREHRGAGIARALKGAQRRRCLEMGLDLVTWTMDPLEARNARFNLARLGAIATRYHDDHYGEMPDKLNVGMPSDRFLIEWRIRSPRVERRLGDAEPIPSLAEMEAEAPYLLAAEGERPLEPQAPRGEARALVAVPADLQALKARDPLLARDWRTAHRGSLGAALGAGYVVTELLLVRPTQPAPAADGEEGRGPAREQRPRAAYLLERHEHHR